MTGICVDCKNNGLIHNHHVVPRILGGTYTVPLCEDCHTKVHDKNMKISALIKAGLRKTHENGTTLGRPTALFDKAEAVKLSKSGLGCRRIGKKLGVSYGTIYKYLKTVKGLHLQGNVSVLSDVDQNT